MKANKKYLLLLMVLTIAVILCGCVATVQQTELGENDEFIYTGSMKANNGRTLNLKVTGDKRDNSLLMTVDEMPAMSLTGHYVKVDGKGYKVYFDDVSNSFAYTQYDPKTRTASFRVNVNMGTYGTERVEFTYHDEAFAKEYDGIGLGKTPPVFTIEGWAGGVIQTYGTLGCNEDGTITVSDAWASPRAGAWSYDENSNVYTIEFTEKTFDKEGVETYPWKRGRNQEGVEIPNLGQTELEEYGYFMGPVTTIYDEASHTYAMTVELLWAMGAWNEITEYQCTYID